MILRKARKDFNCHVTCPALFSQPLFFMTGSLLLLGLYFRGMNKTVVYASALLLLLSLCLNIINMFLSAPSPRLPGLLWLSMKTETINTPLPFLKIKLILYPFFSYGLALKRRRGHETQYTGNDNYFSMIAIESPGKPPGSCRRAYPQRLATTAAGLVVAIPTTIPTTSILWERLRQWSSRWKSMRPGW